uniref:Chromosome 6 C15orf39 homolog n=1 Tax=Mastacembelus armatus TaxID=205130 RepID=A0A3Q3RTR6_9TELE
MMSSQPMQTLIDPVTRNKMPLFDGTVASTGLLKPQNMSGFLGKQTLQYGGAYFAYDPRGKDIARFTPPWNNSKTSLLDSKSPVSQLSGMDGRNHIMYRQDGSSSEEGHSHSSSLCHAPVKQGFTLYTKSPVVRSPTSAASVAVGKQKIGGENSSPPSESSVYLAIPKPVYGHNPCCNELGCMIGQRYSVEHGSPRIPTSVYDHDWMQSDAYYAERPPIQRKVQDTLLQKRGLQLEPGAEALKRMPMETYSPSRLRTFPAMIDPNYSSYPCTPTHTLFGSLSEQSQRLQTPPRGYASLYPSHPTYEHMTSEVYQECSPMSKYGQLAQHPVFYYPQTNVEVENRTQCKDIRKQRENVPVILKHTIPNPREHFIVPHSLHGEIPLPLLSTETLPNHSFMRGFDYPCYTVPRFHLNANQIRPPLKTQHASPSFHSNQINVSPSSRHVDHSATSAASLRNEKSSGVHVDKSHASSPLLHMDQTSPTRRINQPGISPPSIQINRLFSPLSGLHVDRPILPPAGLNVEKFIDCSSCEAQVTCPKQPKGLPVSPAAWPPPSPSHSSDRIHTAVTNSANVRKIIYSPATGNKLSDPPSSSSASVLKGCLKRSLSHSSAPIKIEEDSDLCEVKYIKKRQKLEKENVQVGKKNDSPPMPVIDNVFSLAPYQTYLQASGVLFPGRAPQIIQSSEQQRIKAMPDNKEKRPGQNKQQPVVCEVPKEIWPGTPTEKPVVEISEAKTIKVEKVDPSDTDNSVEILVSQKDCRKIEVKKEPEETGSSATGPILLIKICESDELESKPSLAAENKTSDESKPIEVDLSSQDDTCTLQCKSVTPPQPHESKLSFKNIPPQCLKLSTYKIILPETTRSSPAPPPEKPLAQTVSEFQMPVRKHFLELHHSLCKLVSKSVAASSDQELRTWLSQLELTEPASSSTKIQKVSCLLGVTAREAWLKEEMKSALDNVLERLREYTTQERCPFPHVMRTGAVFLPMLVTKELLFPMVEGSYIDQVLQEHKVELRPTTLSEEKILIQLHKRACSSRLRRLMSLKHLPDIYADVVNLFYYTCVRKHLGLDVDDDDDRKIGTEETISCRTPDFSVITTSLDSDSDLHPQRHSEDWETNSHFNTNRTKKSSLRCMFLANSLTDEEDAEDTEMTVSGGILNAFSKKIWSGNQSEETENRGNDCTAAKKDSFLIPQSTTSENSWTCPLTLDDLSPSPSDTETEHSSSPLPVSQSSEPAKSPVRSKNCSGMILKLRRMFSEGLRKKKAHYQAVSDPGTVTDPSPSQTEDREEER